MFLEDGYIMMNESKVQESSYLRRIKGHQSTSNSIQEQMTQNSINELNHVMHQYS